MRQIQRLTFLLPILLIQSATLSAQITPLPLKSGSVRFAAIGDMGTGATPQYEMAQRMTQFHEMFPFTFVIMLGDNIYGGKTPADLRKKFEIPYKPLLDAGVQFYASLGNHDDTNERFYKFFNMNGQQYYSFKKGNVRFFALDTDYLDPKQLDWLQKELAGAGPNEWKICFFHHPLYSSAAFHGSSTELRTILEPIFLKYGVQVVFSGHDHVYERVKPQKGIYYFTEGASGELRYGNLKKTDLTAAGYDQDRSFLSVEISGDDLNFQAISRTGMIVDSGIIHRSGAEPHAP
ncbi:MAG: metallophosphoesterase [Acidobacteriota bacterium]